ncbi:MAG: DUF3024 domain-containing protein [Deltaproteobacteria bacterium]|nr:DUF3024 domain-containing protein [Deltaproteobacteria bacterium]
MALPEFVAQHAERALAAFCDRRVPARARDQIQLRYSARGDSITLLETRPRWNDPNAAWTEQPIARFDFDGQDGVWLLKCADRNGRWRAYDRVGATKRFEDLLGEIDRDPTGIFWG